MQDELERARTTPELASAVDNTTQGQLTHLSDWKDYKIADGEPNIHGWDVRAMNGEKVGDVEDVLVDSVTRRVRYIEIKLEKDLVANAKRRHALLPMESVQLDQHAKNVHVALDSARLRSLPEYVRGALSREYEQSVVDIFRGAGDRTSSIPADSPTQTLPD